MIDFKNRIRRVADGFRVVSRTREKQLAEAQGFCLRPDILEKPVAAERAHDADRPHSPGECPHTAQRIADPVAQLLYEHTVAPEIAGEGIVKDRLQFRNAAGEIPHHHRQFSRDTRSFHRLKNSSRAEKAGGGLSVDV